MSGVEIRYGVLARTYTMLQWGPQSHVTESTKCLPRGRASMAGPTRLKMLSCQLTSERLCGTLEESRDFAWDLSLLIKYCKNNLSFRI